MKTKKTLAALTAVMMCMSMAACGNTETKSSDPNDITASEAEERLKALDSMSDEEIDELFNGENETTTTTAATTTTTTTTTTAAPAVDPDIPYAYYDDLAEEYEKCGDCTAISNFTEYLDYPSFSIIQAKDKIALTDDREHNNPVSYIYNFGDKEAKKYDKTKGYISYLYGDYFYGFDGKTFYRYDKNMKEVAKLQKFAYNYRYYDYYYGHCGTVYGISSNNSMVLGELIENNGDEKKPFSVVLHFLDSDFKTFKDIPTAERETEHGFSEKVDAIDAKDCAMYENKLYDVPDGLYLTTDDMKWHTFDNSEIKDSYGNIQFNRVIGKYIISEKSIYDMEKDKYVTTNLDKTKGSYYGGDSNIVVKGDKVYKTYVPVNPINVEGRPDELIMSGWDDKSCKILNYKYYLFKDEYGIFLREYGKDTDGEVTLIRF